MSYSSLKSFFLFCSGAHLPFLDSEECQYEHNKYIGIGTAVFFTAVFAFISSSYAFNFVFENVLISLIIGLVWGSFVFSLDRYIVATLKKEENKLIEIFKASPRIVLAILLAIVISKPLELKIFEKEIDQKLIEIQGENEKKQNEAIFSKYPQLDILNQQFESTKQEYFKASQEYDYLMLSAQNEADGSSGTGKRGLGEVYELKKKNADLKKTEKDNLALKLDNVKLKLDSLYSQINLEVNSQERARENGLLARIEALDRLGYTEEIIQPSFPTGLDSTKSIKVSSYSVKSEPKVFKSKNAMYWATWFITVLLISIELAPLLLKIFTEKGNYDLKVRAIEEKQKSREIEEISRLNDEVNTRIRINSGINENSIQQELNDNKNLLKEISRAQLGITKEIIEIWKKEQLKEVKANPEQYIGNRQIKKE